MLPDGNHCPVLSNREKRGNPALPPGQASSFGGLHAEQPLFAREGAGALEEEFPGIGFRDSIGGREAYLLGQRVAVWEVLDVYRAAKAITKTADHFGWPDYLVKCALAYAKAFPDEMAAQRKAEVGE